MEKKAQAWGFDLMIALVIFIGGLVFFYTYSLNYQQESQEKLDEMLFEGDFIAESILSEGFPDDWNENNVVKVGITNNNKVNETKLENLYNLANANANSLGYAKTKSLLNTRYEFFFNFTDEIIFGGVPILEGGIGKNYAAQSYDNLIKINRFTIYRDEPVTLSLYVWDDGL